MHKMIHYFLFFFGIIKSQENYSYQKPPTEILQLVDITLPPRVLFDENKRFMIYLYRDSYKSINELSDPEIKLAGLRLNPNSNSRSRTNYYNNILISKMDQIGKDGKQVKGLPKFLKLANIKWSPDQTKIAMTNTTEEGVELWYIDLEKLTAKKLTGPKLNASLGDVITWYQDSKNILTKFKLKNSPDIIDGKDVVPIGPIISSNDGKKAQNRTYQDLLKNEVDEKNFETLATSVLSKVSLKGKTKILTKKNLYHEIDFSPDGKFILISIIQKPFSYLVPYYRFPMEYAIYSSKGKELTVLHEVPLIEDLPKGFMAVRTGPRNFSWRSDKPSNLIFVEALDDGNPETNAKYRDEIFEVGYPFRQNKVSLLKTINRFYRIDWCNDTLALGYDYWWNTRNTKTYIFSPANPNKETQIIIDRNYQDRYNDPGSFVKKRNFYGKSILAMNKLNLYLMGDGFREDGQFPFIDQLNLKSLKKIRLYESSFKDKKEDLLDFEADNNMILTRIESASEYPNYFFRDLQTNDITKVTDFDNPFVSIMEVSKEVIEYKRSDGINLSASLYLPKGYDINKKQKLPMIMWAYPREFKDNNSASQITQNKNEFTFPYWGSPIYWLTRGYVVLDDVSFPIIGEGENQPNDNFRKQLVDNASAAINRVYELGYIDKEKVAIGGHSYGAFMVANLLSHSKLFAAGIARSGAYNRTLTPFGFQSEERNYWEAPNIYYNMSPFMHAEKVKTPLLLIHGEEDNNSGTYPMQSERYFNALKGLGATTRLVMLPKESHSYRAKESIMHMLWEQDRWLEKYVKNK
tara:strand:+ start:273 stop:2681 length:2409 start_codon:yes stop_codon:yes gene_type:complete